MSYCSPHPSLPFLCIWWRVTIKHKTVLNGSDVGRKWRHLPLIYTANLSFITSLSLQLPTLEFVGFVYLNSIQLYLYRTIARVFTQEVFKQQRLLMFAVWNRPLLHSTTKHLLCLRVKSLQLFERRENGGQCTPGWAQKYANTELSVKRTWAGPGQHDFLLFRNNSDC